MRVNLTGVSTEHWFATTIPIPHKRSKARPISGLDIITAACKVMTDTNTVKLIENQISICIF
jgi:hypothetical protein